MPSQGAPTSAEAMFASVAGIRPDGDPYPRLAPGREKRFSLFLIKFGEDSPQKLNDIMTTPEKYAPIGGPRVTDREDGVSVLIHYMEGGLASPELIEQWKRDQKVAADEQAKQWRKAQKKYKGRGGIPDGDMMTAGLSLTDEAKNKATAYDDELESPLDSSIPAAVAIDSAI